MQRNGNLEWNDPARMRASELIPWYQRQGIVNNQFSLRSDLPSVSAYGSKLN